MQYREFQLRPSRQYLLLLSLVLSASMAVIILLPCAWWLKVMMAAGLSAYGVYLVQQVAQLQGKNAITRIVSCENGWRVHTNQDVLNATLMGDSTVTRLVSILRFKVSTQCRPLCCVMFRDSIANDDYRNFLMTIKST